LSTPYSTWPPVTGGERVLDCYCGVGLFSLFLAEKAGDVIAVDIDREAVGAARKTFAPSAMGRPAV